MDYVKFFQVPPTNKTTPHGCSAAESLQDALKQLFLIDAIDENGNITSIGNTMSGMLFSSN